MGGGYLDAATNCHADSFLGRLKSTSSFSLFLVEPWMPRVSDQLEIRLYEPRTFLPWNWNHRRCFSARTHVAPHILAHESKCLKRSNPPPHPAPHTLPGMSVWSLWSAVSACVHVLGKWTACWRCVCSQAADKDPAEDRAHSEDDHHRVYESSMDQCKHTAAHLFHRFAFFDWYCVYRENTCNLFWRTRSKYK